MIKCTCGHRVHPLELERQLYYNPDHARVSVVWKCCACKCRKYKSFTVADLGIGETMSASAIFKVIKKRAFIMDTTTPEEQVRIERLPAITQDEVLEIRKMLEVDDMLTILGGPL